MKNYEREDVLHFLLKSLVKQIDINDDNCFLLEVRDKYGTTSQDNIARWLCSDYVKPEHKWTKWELETMSHISPFYEALSKGEREGTIVLWGDEDDGWNSDQTVDIYFPSLKYTSTKEEFNKQEQERQDKERQEFNDKYLQDEFLWEFSTLSMFLTNNPMKDMCNDRIPDWETVPEGNNGVIAGVITGITKKKTKQDKRQYAFLQVYSSYDRLMECACWANQYAEYKDYIKTGNVVILLCQKRDNSIAISKIKDYNEWEKEGDKHESQY